MNQRMVRHRAVGIWFLVLGLGIPFGAWLADGQNPNGPPGTGGRRIPPSVSSLDFKQLQYLRARDIVELDPRRVSYIFDAALRNPQKFQQEALEAANNLLRNAPGSAQAAVADVYVIIAQFRFQGRIDEGLQQQLGRITHQYPLSPAVAVAFQTICQELLMRGEPQVAVDLLKDGASHAVNDQQKQWFTEYLDFVRKGANLPAEDETTEANEETDEPIDDGQD